MERTDSQEIEEDELSDLETAIDNVTDRLSIFLDDSYKLNPADTIMLSPEEEAKDFDLKLTNPDSSVKAMEFELQMKSLVETVHINCEQTLQDSSQESFSAPIQMPDTPPDTPVTSPTFSEQDDPVRDENEQAEMVVEVMTAITDKLSEMSDNSGFHLVNEEYTMSEDSLPNIMAVESSVIAVHSQLPVARQISDVSDDLEDLAKECKTDIESSSSDESEREDSPDYITPVLMLPTPPPQDEGQEEEVSTPRSDETSDASYSEASYSECDSCKKADTGHVHVDLLLPSTIDEDETRSELEMETVELIAESLSEDDPSVEVNIPTMEVVEVELVKSVPSVMLEELSLDRGFPSVPSVVLETPSFEEDASVTIDLDSPCIMSEPSIDLDNIEEPTIDIDDPAVDNLCFVECEIKLTEPSIIMDDQNSVNGYSELEHQPSDEEVTSTRPKLERVETIDSLYAQDKEELSSSSSSESEEDEMTGLSELDLQQSEVVLGVPVEPTPSPEVPGDGIVIEADLAMDIKFPVHMESKEKTMNIDKYLKEREEENGDKMKRIENDEDDQYLDDGRRFSEVMRIPDDDFKPSKEVIEEEKELIMVFEEETEGLEKGELETGAVLLETEKYFLEEPEETLSALRIKCNSSIPCEPVPSTLESDSQHDNLKLEDSLGLVTPASLELDTQYDSLETVSMLVTPSTPTLKAEIDAKLQAADDSSSDESLDTDDECDDHDQNLSPEFKSILDHMTSSASEDKMGLKKSDSSCSDSSRSTVENELLNDIDIEKNAYERNPSVPLEMSNDLMSLELSNGVEDVETPEPHVEVLEREETLEPEVQVEVHTPVPDESPAVTRPVLVKTDIRPAKLIDNDTTIEYDSTVDYGSQFSLDPPVTAKLDTSIILDDNNVSMTRSPNTTLNTTAPNMSLNGTLSRDNKLSIKTKIPGKDPRVGKSFYLAFKIKMDGFNLKAKDVEKNAEVELWREGIKLSIMPKFKKGYFLYKIRNCGLRDSGMYMFKAKLLDYSVQCGEDINVIEKGTRRSKSTGGFGSLGNLGSILSLNKNRNNQS